MNRNKIILLVFGVVLLIAVLTAPRFTATKDKAVNTAQPLENNITLSFQTLFAEASEHLLPYQKSNLDSFDKAMSKQLHTADSAMIFFKLSKYWKDSLHNFSIASNYLKKYALLDNSEKTLTFAAQLLVDTVMITQVPALQTWYASQAKELFETVLLKNNQNDSAKIGLAACYIFGNISNNPMQGILPLKEIVEKNPKNISAQTMLALGGRRSGQYAKAIERFAIIVGYEPNNLEAIVNLAECNELNGNKSEAVKWYGVLKTKITDNTIEAEIDNRIKNLSK